MTQRSSRNVKELRHKQQTSCDVTHRSDYKALTLWKPRIEYFQGAGNGSKEGEQDTWVEAVMHEALQKSYKSRFLSISTQMKG